MKLLKTLFSICLSVGLVTTVTAIDEDYVGKEQPDKNIIGQKLSPVDIEEAFSTIDAYIYSRPPASDQISVFDRVLSKRVTLSIEKIHKEPIHSLGNRNVAVKATFTAEDGTPYTLWFAVGPDRTKQDVYEYGRQTQIDSINQMKVKDVTIQKAGDTERYTWKQKGDRWHTVK